MQEANLVVQAVDTVSLGGYMVLVYLLSMPYLRYPYSHPVNFILFAVISPYGY